MGHYKTYEKKGYAVCGTCGETDRDADGSTSLCTNGHDDWFELSDTVENVISAAVKLGVTPSELVEAMKTGEPVKHDVASVTSFTKSDLESAYYAGQTQANAEWNNACSSSIGYRNERADDDFDSWYAETYQKKNSKHINK